jgi:hypothetical protein
MPSRYPNVRRLAARIAASARWHRPDLADLQRELAIARLAHEIEDVTQDEDVSAGEACRLADVVLGRPANDEVSDDW